MIAVICLLPIIPIRKEPSHRSEQTSQLLFGERAEVISQKENWMEIVTLFDSYKGWVEQQSVVSINNPDLYQNTMVTTDAITSCEYHGNNIFLAAGSEITHIDASNSFRCEKNVYKINGPVPAPKEYSPTSILDTASQFLNAPYLWGGRTVFGFDCSGFTQIIFKIHGKKLPRDAKDQANAGIAINSFADLLPGDLAFFSTPQDIISHVGIALNNKQIIHASVFVKIDTLDEKGIFNLKRNLYTHSLKLIRRIV